MITCTNCTPGFKVELKLTVEVMVENTSMRYGTKIAQHKVQLPFHSFYYFYVAQFSCLRQHFIVND